MSITDCEKSSLSFKKDRPRESVGNGQRVLQQEDPLTELTILKEHLGWNYNAVLTGISFKIDGGLWKAFLKCEMAQGPKIAYFTGDSLYQLVETVHWYASKALISWHHDKRPVWFSKRKPRYHAPRRS